jgi:phosphate/sulfate permease
MNKKKESSKKRKGLYVIGSIALAVGGFIAMPKIIDFLSTKMYRTNPASKKEADDNWGPEIVRREKKGDKPDGEL